METALKTMFLLRFRGSQKFNGGKKKVLEELKHQWDSLHIYEIHTVIYKLPKVSVEFLNTKMLY